ncbi:hypothetical protein B0H10DRAFT_2197645 [Mycena sp. CBHHK59/15]|nr:hypothetical protein B0H10DRAFT_2197645 [Mycena sp. CBHHK59/15]
MPYLSTDLTLSSAFNGCNAEAGVNSNMSTNAIITSCCTAVGSTAVTANGTFGCPYNVVWNATEVSTQEFGACASKLNASSACVNFELTNRNAAMPGLARNGVAFATLVGAALLSLVL